MRTTAVTWSDDDESSSSSSDQEDRESSDPSASGKILQRLLKKNLLQVFLLGANFNKFGWYPPPFIGGTYLHPNHRLMNYPLLQQEEYVKCFSKFLYNRGNRPVRGRGRRYCRPRSPYRRSRSRSRSCSRSRSRRNSRRSRSSDRRSRGRSWSTSSASSRGSSRRRKSRSRSRSRRKD